MKKKILFSFILCLGIIALLSINSKAKVAPSFEKDKIVIYAVNESTLEQFPELEIPEEYPQQYQIKINNTTTDIKNIKFDSYYINNYVDISEEGIITPKKYYNSKGQVTYNFDDIDIYAYVDGIKIYFNVEVKDYTYTYVNNKLKKIADSFDGLSNMEKVKKFAEYVAVNYDYGNCSNHVGMYLYGYGNCDASTHMINKLCEFAGIKAEMRIGIHDAGAGSGHVNSVVLVDGKVYIVEAGFDMSKPRTYVIYPHEEPYTYKINDDGTIMLYQYDGFEEEKLVIPSKIDGHKVTGISSSFYRYSTKWAKEIVLPDTITTIEEDAFMSATYLEKINIPESVTDIQGIIFDGCKENINITLEGNSNYVIENDILYNKEKTEFIEVLPTFKSSSYVMPDTIKEIPLNAFYTNQKIKEVKLPNNLEKISQNAFNTAQQLTSITIPKSVKKIEYAAFKLCTRLETIEFEDGCEAEIGEYAFYQVYGAKAIRIPATITNIADTAFGIVGKDTIIYGEKGSAAETYANKHNISFKPLSEYDDTKVDTAPITGVTLSKTSLSLTKGGTSTLTATIVPTNTTDSKTITWTSSNTAVATVSGGKVTAVGSGTATITAKTSNGKTATCTVTVKDTTTTYILGDINKDGKVNARDAKLALQCYVGKIKLTDEQKTIGDVNKDGKVNARDAKLILQYYVGKIKKF